MKSRIFRKATAIVALVAGLACPASWALWEQVTTVPQWAPRFGHTSLVFDGKMWIFGGSGEGLQGDWYSSDGVHWLAVPGKTPWSGIPVVFGGKIWAFGKDRTPSHAWRTWNSSDGLTWTEAGGAPPWAPRVSCPIAVLDGKMWVVGGVYDDFYKDVWSSSDGIAWTQVTSAVPWPIRQGHTLTVLDGKMWLIGGFWYDQESSTYFNDVWSSSDGVTWTAATTSAPWAKRRAHTAIAWGGKLWVIGGTDGNYTFSDVWSSADGANWTQVSSDEALDPVSGHASLVFGDRLWTIGGHTTTDVWNSPDGFRWTRVTQGAPWGKRCSHASVVFDNKLWVLGGSLNWNSEQNDVWSSINGQDWDLVTSSAAWLPRYGHSSVVHGGKIWVIGGESYSTHQVFNDVWYSTDGRDWNVATNAAPWRARSGHASVAFAGKMWVMGGGNNLNDIWCSSDGTTWEMAAPTAPWRGRSFHAAIVLGDRIWVIGGLSLDLNCVNDAWSSSDGVVWREETPSAPWNARYAHSCAVLGDSIWIVGGTTPGRALSDTWHSQDSATWIEASSTAPWRPRYVHTTVAFKNRLWLMGGLADSRYFSDVWSTTDGRSFEFTTLPSGGWKEEGSPLTLRVEASEAAGAITYQWVKDGIKIDGATNETFTISALAASDQGTYSCFVTNSSGTDQQTPLALVEVFPERSLPVLHPAGLAILMGGFLLAGLRALNRLQTGCGRTPVGASLAGLMILAVCAMDYASAAPGKVPEFYHYVDTIGKVPLVLNKEKIGIRFDGPISASTQQSVLTTVPGLQPSSSLEAVDSRGTMLATLAPGATASSVIATVRSLSKASGVYFASPVVQTNPGFDEMLTNQFYASFPTSVTREAVEAYNKVQGVETVKVVDLPKRGKTSYQLRLTKAATLDALAMSNLYYEKLGLLVLLSSNLLSC